MYAMNVKIMLNHFWSDKSVPHELSLLLTIASTQYMENSHGIVKHGDV